MCIFVSPPMKIVTVLRKNGDHPKRIVDFPLERDTFRNKIMEIVEDVDAKSYNNNGKPWKSLRILRVNPNFFIFYHFFSIFSFFFHFSFSFIFFHFLSFSFIFFHFLSFSFIFLHFPSFSFIFFVFVGCSKSDFFWASISFRFLFTIFFCKKSIFWAHLGLPLWGLLSFFSYFFSPVLSFLVLLIFHFFSFFVHFFIFYVFHFLFSFFPKKSFFFSFFLYFLQICFIAGISIRVYLFPP